MPAQGSSAKVTATCASAASATEQSADPVQAPPQVKLPPAWGVAASATVAPSGKRALHVPGQLMPAGVEATVPWPVTATVSVSIVGLSVRLLKLTKIFLVS